MENIVVVNCGRMNPRLPQEDAIFVYKTIDETAVGFITAYLGCRCLRDDRGQPIAAASDCPCGVPAANQDFVDHTLCTGGLRCHVDVAHVHPDHRRHRFGHEMMYELERRWPGVTTSQPVAGNKSVDSWYALREEIMRTGNPHIGRDDLPPYTPSTLPTGVYNVR